MPDKSTHILGSHNLLLPTWQSTSYDDYDDGYYQKGRKMTNRIIDNGDGTFTDRATNLMWVQNVNKMAPTFLNLPKNQWIKELPYYEGTIGVIVSFEVNNPGTGYQPYDEVRIKQGENESCWLLRLSTGEWIFYDEFDTGSGYTTANNVPCVGGSGTGLTVNIIATPLYYTKGDVLSNYVPVRTPITGVNLSRSNQSFPFTANKSVFEPNDIGRLFGIIGAGGYTITGVITKVISNTQAFIATYGPTNSFNNITFAPSSFFICAESYQAEYTSFPSELAAHADKWVETKFKPFSIQFANAQFSLMTALEIINNLNYAGYNDWRLPNIMELYSVLSIENIYDIIGDLEEYGSNGYLSSTSARGASFLCLKCIPSRGIIVNTEKIYGLAGVIPVRGGH